MHITTTTKQTKQVDVTKYRLVAFQLRYFDKVLSQVILPVVQISSIRSITSLIDGNGQYIVCVDFQDCSVSQVSGQVIKDFGSGANGKIYGIN